MTNKEHIQTCDAGELRRILSRIMNEGIDAISAGFCETANCPRYGSEECDCFRCPIEDDYIIRWWLKQEYKRGEVIECT